MTATMVIDEPTKLKPDTAEDNPAERGIALCLGMLADEAADLGLADTSLAIRRAIGACLLEASGRAPQDICRIN